MNMFDSLLTTVGIIVGVLVLAVIAFQTRYKTVSPDKAMIVTGSFLGSKNVVSSNEPGASQRKVKIVSGGGAFVLPIFQSYRFLSLLSHKIDVTTPEVYTEEGVPIRVDATAIIKIRGTMEDIFAAAERYLGKPEHVLQAEATEVLEGHLRSILGTMTVEEIYKNRDKFAQQVQDVSGKDLKKMGLHIDSFTIKDIKDDNGYLESLGKPRIAAVKRDAEIAEAEARKEAAIKKAQADEQAKKAELQRDIAVAEATKEKDLRVAEFKRESDKAKAEADSAYQIQQEISRQQIIEAKMKAEQIQKERDIELAEKEAIRQEKELEATVKKQADAELYRRQREAEAAAIERTKQAEAQAFERTKQVEVNAIEIEKKAQAEAESKRRLAAAEAEQIRLQAEAEANSERLRGQALADAEKAKAEAEAEAERLKGLAHAEAEKAKAEADRALGLAKAEVERSLAEVEVDKEKGLAEAALALGQLKVVELFAKVLPEIAGQIAAPMGNIDKITIVEAGGEGNGVSKLTNSVTNLMHTLPTVVEDLTGIKLGEVLKNLTNGRLSGEPFDPNSLLNVAKALKGVDGNFAGMLEDMVQRSASVDMPALDEVSASDADPSEGEEPQA